MRRSLPAMMRAAASAPQTVPTNAAWRSVEAERHRVYWDGRAEALDFRRVALGGAGSLAALVSAVQIGTEGPFNGITVLFGFVSFFAFTSATRASHNRMIARAAASAFETKNIANVSEIQFAQFCAKHPVPSFDDPFANQQ